MNQPHRVPSGKRWLRLASSAPSSSSEAKGTPLDDETLIAAVVDGKTHLAGAIHDHLIGSIDASLFRVMGAREVDHDDLVQSTFEQIVMTIRRGRFARACSLRTWASAVAAHVGLNALRSRRTARRLFDPVSLADIVDNGVALDFRSMGDSEREIIARARIRSAQSHLTAMKDHQALMLIQHDVFGHELTEIATMLGISVSAAQSRLVRARREFLRRTKDEGRLTKGGNRDG